MSSPINVDKKTITELLGRHVPRPIKLPQFQRSYSWELSHVSTFWRDFHQFYSVFEKHPKSSLYFLGPIVTIEQKEEVLLLDGQQRLATATILFAALRDRLRALDNETEEKVKLLAHDIQRDLILKDEDAPEYSLELSELDEPFFLQRIKQDKPVQIKPSLRSHRLIDGCYTFFSQQLDTFFKGKSQTEIYTSAKMLKDCIAKGANLIVITVDSEEDAYNIFETLNDRGLRLSVPDLLINLLLRRCDTDAARSTVREKWNSLLQRMGKRDVARFLRHYWLSLYGDVKTHGLYAEIRDHLQKKGLASLHFVESCYEECDKYISLIEFTAPVSKKVKNYLEGLIKHLDVQNALPLVLAGFVCLSSSDFEKLLKRIVSVYIRHTLISNQNPTDLETAFYEAARLIRSSHESGKSSKQALSAAKRLLDKHNPTDSLVLQKTGDLVLSESEAGWIMREIANSEQSATKEIGMDDANVEHVFPQNAGSEWPDRTTLEPYVWHVGNLTILGRKKNNKAANKAYADKYKDQYSKSEIRITKSLPSGKAWDVAAIQKRAAEYGKMIIKIWS